MLVNVWLEDVSMSVIDSVGDEFISYAEDGMTITVKGEGIVEVD